jgi:hypothetical protein
MSLVRNTFQLFLMNGTCYLRDYLIHADAVPMKGLLLDTDLPGSTSRMKSTSLWHKRHSLDVLQNRAFVVMETTSMPTKRDSEELFLHFKTGSFRTRSDELIHKLT